MPTTKESIQIELATHKPTEEERQVLRSALFRVITPMALGAVSLGLSASLIGKSRQWKRTYLTTFLGVNIGILFGGLLGTNRGMNKLREGLPEDSKILSIIHELDELKKNNN
ncbi:hypothetical protein RO3G_15965 [Rhizopus delemar RA 99-880]|uniref:Uncharacterized protein n=1 Tax=Rhizopus delemar (strain RA 99-880 / ATCC MYA-4621 / FGSC 9543 / NRRL 43880) TaxID=246409 RepID=I1CS24_RHIO9|nr:hypothetical protein RO3G_15965 [Rhizopus delemar RA 99-880]|eukprot:EIE91254.1 hypothetical protein RO3G_15965 [Rhizopus delemar RA 99-880]